MNLSILIVKIDSGQNEQDSVENEQDGCPADLNRWFVNSINEVKDKLDQGDFEFIYGESEKEVKDSDENLNGNKEIETQVGNIDRDENSVLRTNSPRQISPSVENSIVEVEDNADENLNVSEEIETQVGNNDRDENSALRTNSPRQISPAAKVRQFFTA